MLGECFTMSPLFPTFLMYNLPGPLQISQTCSCSTHETFGNSWQLLSPQCISPRPARKGAIAESTYFKVRTLEVDKSVPVDWNMAPVLTGCVCMWRDTISRNVSRNLKGRGWKTRRTREHQAQSTCKIAFIPLFVHRQYSHGPHGCVDCNTWERVSENLDKPAWSSSRLSPLPPLFSSSAFIFPLF